MCASHKTDTLPLSAQMEWKEEKFESPQGDGMDRDIRRGQSWRCRCYLQGRETALAFALRRVVKERLQTGRGCKCLAGLRHTIGVQVK